MEQTDNHELNIRLAKLRGWTVVDPTRKAKGPKPKPIRERFLKKVACFTDRSICWNWPGTKCRSGYGLIRTRTKNTKAHRVSWEVSNGRPIPDGLFVLHACDNPSCVNPDHLFLGNSADNIQDMLAKGRRSYASVTGERNVTSKLRDYQALEIRRMHKEGYTDYEQLAKRYGVSAACIRDTIKGRTYKHLLNVDSIEHTLAAIAVLGGEK